MNDPRPVNSEPTDFEALGKINKEVSNILSESLTTEKTHYNVLVEGRDFFKLTLTAKYRKRFSKSELELIEKEILPSFNRLIEISVLLTQQGVDIAIANTPEEMIKRLGNAEIQKKLTDAFAQASILQKKISLLPPDKKGQSLLDKFDLITNEIQTQQGEKSPFKQKAGSYLIVPVQRGPRYFLLAKTYLENLLKTKEILSKKKSEPKTNIERDIIQNGEKRVEELESAKKLLEKHKGISDKINESVRDFECKKIIESHWPGKESAIYKIEATQEVSFLGSLISEKSAAYLQKGFSSSELNKISYLISIIPDEKTKKSVLKKLMENRNIHLEESGSNSNPKERVLILNNGTESIQPSPKDFVKHFSKNFSKGDKLIFVINEIDGQTRDWFKAVIAEAKKTKNVALLEMIKESAWPADKGMTQNEVADRIEKSSMVFHTPHLKGSNGVLIAKPLNILNQFKSTNSQDLHEKATTNPSFFFKRQ